MQYNFKTELYGYKHEFMLSRLIEILVRLFHSAGSCYVQTLVKCQMITILKTEKASAVTLFPLTVGADLQPSWSRCLISTLIHVLWAFMHETYFRVQKIFDLLRNICFVISREMHAPQKIDITLLLRRSKQTLLYHPNCVFLSIGGIHTSVGFITKYGGQIFGGIQMNTRSVVWMVDIPSRLFKPLIFRQIGS